MIPSRLLFLPSLAIALSLPGSCEVTTQASSPSPPSPPSPTVAADSPLAQMERLVHEQVNRYRTQQGFSPLRLDPLVSQQARQHSQAMATGRVPFGHQGFDRRIEVISRQISYRAAAENVGYNQGYGDPATRAVEGWIDSPSHRSNMQGSYDITGVGIAKNAKDEYYFTQIFLRTPSP